ncbi:hypothetical protein D8674_010083 [Pyrus ussuriensis x Pyrus communis]|uniref:Non-haem dioxygenase N-terminal domain-containing protein n=1 Tax=Pyrus ussuriensis x Pyrus communis TaxID=2448454 RepID=A0A5N5FF01_9ROSA|nr:hypothetical protein D8674_010083 [Pyrus ussuriensis x Pyrus communis]
MLFGNSRNQDHLQQLKTFDDSKAGVKGIDDGSITKITCIFVCLSKNLTGDKPNIPIVDLADTAAQRHDVVAGVRFAAETVGFFQVVNHVIPNRVLEKMLKVEHRFYELPKEVKAMYYSRERARKVKFRSNFDLYKSRFASWRDILFCVMGPDQPFVGTQFARHRTEGQ